MPVALLAGIEVCSKPPAAHKAKASSSGNMLSTYQQAQDAEQAGSVEQPAPAVAKPGRLWRPATKGARRGMSSAPTAWLLSGMSCIMQ